MAPSRIRIPSHVFAFGLASAPGIAYGGLETLVFEDENAHEIFTFFSYVARANKYITYPEHNILDICRQIKKTNSCVLKDCWGGM